MKRPLRQWWKVAGSFVAALAAFAAAVAFSGSSAVKLEFVEYAKRPAMRSGAGTNELSKQTEVLVAVARVKNESGSEVELSQDYPFSAPIEKDGDPLYEQRFRGHWDSTLPARLKQNGASYVDVPMTTFDEPWITFVCYRRKGRWIEFCGSLIDWMPGFIKRRVPNYHPLAKQYVELGPVTNLPPREWLTNTRAGLNR